MHSIAKFHDFVPFHYSILIFRYFFYATYNCDRCLYMLVCLMCCLYCILIPRLFMPAFLIEFFMFAAVAPQMRNTSNAESNGKPQYRRRLHGPAARRSRFPLYLASHARRRPSHETKTIHHTRAQRQSTIGAASRRVQLCIVNYKCV